MTLTAEERELTAKLVRQGLRKDRKRLDHFRRQEPSAKRDHLIEFYERRIATQEALVEKTEDWLSDTSHKEATTCG